MIQSFQAWESDVRSRTGTGSLSTGEAASRLYRAVSFTLPGPALSMDISQGLWPQITETGSSQVKQRKYNRGGQGWQIQGVTEGETKSCLGEKSSKGQGDDGAVLCNSRHCRQEGEVDLLCSV